MDYKTHKHHKQTPQTNTQMKTLEEIIENNIENLKKAKEKLMNEGNEALANETQININVLLGTLHEYKNQ